MARPGLWVFWLHLTAATVSDYTFCERKLSDGWATAVGSFAFGASDAASGAGCRLESGDSDLNVLWLLESRTNYSVTAVGRPEISGELPWSVYLRIGGYDEWNFPECFDCVAYACTVDLVEGALSVIKGEIGKPGDGNARETLAATAVPYSSALLQGAALWELYGVAAGSRIGCELALADGSRYRVDAEDVDYGSGGPGVGALGERAT